MVGGNVFLVAALEFRPGPVEATDVVVELLRRAPLDLAVRKVAASPPGVSPLAAHARAHGLLAGSRSDGWSRGDGRRRSNRRGGRGGGGSGRLGLVDDVAALPTRLAMVVTGAGLAVKAEAEAAADTVGAVLAEADEATARAGAIILGARLGGDVSGKNRGQG